MKNLKIAKFVIDRNKLSKIKGASGGSSAKCCDCGCVSTTSNGCIDGGGVDLGKKTSSIN